eukprot:CAMPEP_0185771130 /NCGR_PEP_ID=MMETSP1174-20130828/63301_1 /TAXON_ID=35687 /ORGANISM="Dictyocha speculum, Strain CCMP1381" /LENGTH=828 /DNA_ID=CAMNT_0028456883 /DNA_START=157 /DNA_END=2643 /DNA_ORIENTATION=+
MRLPLIRGMSTSSNLTKIIFQLDYHISSQFAGLLVAQEEGLYHAAGVEVELIPPVTPGQEPKSVLNAYAGRSPDEDALYLGCCEQNVLVPAITADRSPVVAVSTMLHGSPLALASLSGTAAAETLAQGSVYGLRIGVQPDCTQLLGQLLELEVGDAGVTMVEIERGGKFDALSSGTIDAVQIYTTTEAIEFEAALGVPPVTLPFGALAPKDTGLSVENVLGSAQVVFMPREQAACEKSKAPLDAFLKATYDGWQLALKDTRKTANLVQSLSNPEALPTTLGQMTEEDYHHRVLLELQPFIQPHGADIGRVSVQEWVRSCQVLEEIGMCRGRRPSLWQTALSSTLLLPSSPIAGATSEALDGRASAKEWQQETFELSQKTAVVLGRRPKLKIIRLGDTTAEATKRAGLFIPDDMSWFSKVKAGAAVGVDVEEVTVAEHDLEALHSIVLDADCDPSVDAFILERPTVTEDALEGDHSARQVTKSAILEAAASLSSVGKDVDGATDAALGHAWSLASQRTGVTSNRMGAAHVAPTVAGMLRLLDRAGLQDLTGKLAVVVGRSHLVGSPIAASLVARDATVIVTHSRTASLSDLTLQADIVIVAAGGAGLLTPEMISRDTLVVNVGTTLDSQGPCLRPDVEQGDDQKEQGIVVTPSPGGVGSLCCAALFHNVVQAAAATAALTHNGGGRASQQKGSGAGDRIRDGCTADEPTLDLAQTAELVDAYEPGLADWSVGELYDGCLSLNRSFTCRDFQAALDLMTAVGGVAEAMNHHPMKMALADFRVVTISLSSSAPHGLTRFDLGLASEIQKLEYAPFEGTFPLNDFCGDGKVV